jgi:hypothetical protein
VIASENGERVNATDWQATGQLADNLERTHWPGFLPLQTFQERISPQHIDMTDFSAIPACQLDFG